MRLLVDFERILAVTLQALRAVLGPIFFQELQVLLQGLTTTPKSISTEVDILIDMYEPRYRRGVIRVYIDGKLCIIHLSRSGVLCLLPLGAVAAATCIFDRLRALWLRHPAVRPHTDFILMCDWLSTSKLADVLSANLEKVLTENLEVAQHLSTPLNKRNCLGHLSILEITELGIARSLPAAEAPTFWARAFLVEKSDHKTSRFIWNGGNFDILFHATFGPEPPMPRLHMRDAVRRLLAGWRRISTADFKSFFFQFGLHPALQRLFGFYMHGTALAMTVMPMGICFAPSWAQHVSLYLVELIHARLPSVEFDIIVWIDNLVLLCNSVADEKLIQDTADDLFAEVNLVTKGWQDKPADGGNIIEVLGVNVNLRDHLRPTVRPTDAEKQELREARSKFYKERTIENLFRFTGKVMWFSYVGGIPRLRSTPTLRTSISPASTNATRYLRSRHHAPRT